MLSLANRGRDKDQDNKIIVASDELWEEIVKVLLHLVVFYRVVILIISLV